MASGEVLHSFALLDADGKLIDWDRGFAEEFRFAAPHLKPGISYGEILKLALNDPSAQSFLRNSLNFSDAETLIQSRLGNFGADRTREYKTSGGRIIHVDERRTSTGNIRRLARDVTDERQAEDALVEAQQRLDAADSDIDGVYTETIRKPDGSYIFPPISDALRRMLDLPVEAVGRDPMVIYSRMIRDSGDDAQQAALMEHSAQTLEICPMEYRIRDGKNRIRWIRQSQMPRREDDGTVIFSGTMRDVTREKEAEDQVELLRSIVLRSSDSMVVFETSVSTPPATRIVYVNSRFCELFGGVADELMGQPIEALEENNLDDVGTRLISEALARDDGMPVEFESRRRDGRIFWVEARVETVQRFDNGTFRWVIISRDIGERRRAQEEMLRAKEAAEAGNRAKSNFLANMSHELRTPLNAIIGFTELIEDGVRRTGWIPSYTEYLGDVSSSGRHLLELINTILDLSKIEAGSLELDLAPVNLRELVETSLPLVSGMAQEGGVALSMEIPDKCPLIPGDFLKLKQVLLNILSNAVKFTFPGGKVVVHVDCSDDHEAVIAVADTGCGISKSDLERVMLPFVQAENALSRRFSGSGLGLPIARELCMLHRGRLAIESEVGRGTTVRIILPRQSPE